MAAYSTLYRVGTPIFSQLDAYTDDDLSDIANARSQIVFTAILETDLIIVCASIPVIYPLFVRRRSEGSSSGMTLSSRAAKMLAFKKKREAQGGSFGHLEDSVEDLNPASHDIRLETVITINEDVHHEISRPFGSSNSQTWN